MSYLGFESYSNSTKSVIVLAILNMRSIKFQIYLWSKLHSDMNEDFDLYLNIKYVETQISINLNK